MHRVVPVAGYASILALFGGFTQFRHIPRIALSLRHYTLLGDYEFNVSCCSF